MYPLQVQSGRYAAMSRKSALANGTRRLYGCVWLTLALCLLLPLQLLAQDAMEVEAVSDDELAALSSELEQNTELSDSQRGDLQAKLARIPPSRDQAQKFNAVAQDYETRAAGAAESIQRFQRQLEQAKANPPEPSRFISADADAEELDSQITLLQAERKNLADRRSELLKRVEQAPERRAERQNRLAEVNGDIEANRSGFDATGSTLDQRILKALARARHLALTAEQASLEQALLTEPARSDVDAAERAWLEQAIEDADVRLEALSAAAEAARASATEEKLEATAALQQEAQNEDPQVQALVEGNRRLAEDLKSFSALLEIARSDGRAMQAELEALEEDFTLMRRRLDVAGRMDVLSRVMVSRLDSLRSVSTLREGMKAREDSIADTSIAYIDIDEQQRQLSRERAYLADLGIDTATLDPATAELVAKALEQRRQFTQTGLRNLGTLQRTLIDNNELAEELIGATGNFRQFLMGNLLWVRNFTFFDVGLLVVQLEALFSPYNWIALPQQVYTGFQQAAWSIVLLVLLLSLFLFSWRLRSAFEALMRKPTPLSGESLLNMLLGFLLSLLLILPWPFALWLLGYSLDAFEPNTEFTEAIAPAFMMGGGYLAALLLFRRLIRPFGMGRRQLKWDARMLDAVRRELNWAGPLVVIATTLEAFAIEHNVVVAGGPLGSICIAAIAITLIVVALRLQRQQLFSEERLLRNSLLVLAAASLAILFMQLLGLLFAAETFMTGVMRSLAAVLMIKVINDVIERWLLILRGRLERRTREEVRALEESGDELPEDADAWVDMVSLSEAHSRLLGLLRVVVIVGTLWLIWAPTLPGLTLFEDINLWQVADVAAPDGVRYVTLADLLLSVVILAVTVLVVKHLPPVFKAFMLEWFQASAGARYAYGILMQYVLVAIGGAMFLSSIGWEWSRLQWLVAALGVGIGFGLQEIVANFISGIIILFERPVRVGDIISVAGAEGEVLEIKTRATMIRTFEFKEVLIPNKELITGQVVNWTLTGNAIRILVPVGVAYGSDVREAIRLLEEAAGEVPLILAEPAPMASFDDFGDNALLLTLRCYGAEQRLAAWTELRNCINDKFAAAGIEISFPQRDVHLDTRGPLQVELRGQRTGGDPEGAPG